MVFLNNITYPYKKASMVAVYSLGHFLVDFACAFLMFRSVAGTTDWFLCVLLYNFFAFAFQMPLGLIADRCNKNYLFAVVGCVIVALAYGFFAVPAAVCIILGVGNAFFHIGGGIDILNISEKKSAALGIFVSPGAFGIYFGTILGKGDGAFAFYILGLLLLFAVLIVFVRFLQGNDYKGNAVLSLETAGTNRMHLAVICLFLVVCLRSFVGLTMNFSWKSIGNWGLILICAVAFGKTLGGFAADRFGMKKTTLVSLSAAAVLFAFSYMPLSGVSAVLLFNMTMPVTLFLMAKIFPGAKGFSFGLLTFALFIGFLPVYLGAKNPTGSYYIFSVAAVVSILLLYVGLRKVGTYD